MRNRQYILWVILISVLYCYSGIVLAVPQNDQEGGAEATRAQQKVENKIGNRSQVAIKEVDGPPRITIIQPQEGAELSLGTTDTVAVVIEFGDPFGIDMGSFSAEINDADVADPFTVSETGATGALSTRLPTGSNTLSVTIRDNQGLGRTVTSQFTVSYVPPTVSLGADPATVKFGEYTMLSWESSNADKVNIEPGIGEVELIDSVPAAIFENVTYTITAIGPGGTATHRVDVDVTEIPPPGIYYQYDALGRMKRIIRMTSPQSR